jgi:hypothetical protein
LSGKRKTHTHQAFKGARLHWHCASLIHVESSHAVCHDLQHHNARQKEVMQRHRQGQAHTSCALWKRFACCSGSPVASASWALCRPLFLRAAQLPRPKPPPTRGTVLVQSMALHPHAGMDKHQPSGEAPTAASVLPKGKPVSKDENYGRNLQFRLDCLAGPVTVCRVCRQPWRLTTAASL